MSIIKTITNDYEFAEWIKQSDGYNFSLEAAKAVQAYYEQLSEGHLTVAEMAREVLFNAEVR